MAIDKTSEPLQSLLADDQIENIEVFGPDTVWLQYPNGDVKRGPAIADTEQQLAQILTRLGNAS